MKSIVTTVALAAFIFLACQLYAKEEAARASTVVDADGNRSFPFENLVDRLENPEEAVANYRVLVETYPDNKFAVEALKRVAEIMDDKERYEESVASYHQIFELYPKNDFAPEALLEIEQIYRKRMNNYEKEKKKSQLYFSRLPIPLC